MKVALVHDFLAQNGGAEKVLEVLHEMFPKAPIYTLLYDAERVPQFKDCEIRTSFIQNLPFAKKKYQWYLPLMPLATESYDLTGYDLVISSSSAMAKGIITSPETVHLCYCHTPTRYLWTDTQTYVDNLKYPKLIKKSIRMYLSHLRLWDRLASDRVDHFIANSGAVRKRIQKYYRRDSEIIYPPVETDKLSIDKTTKDEIFFLTGGRLVAYKRFDLTVEAFNRLGIPLKIFGTGPEMEKLKKIAKPHIQFLGYVSDEKRKQLYQKAQAFIHPQIEDFGITCVEPMACGTPIIAYAKDGALEIVKDGITGLFFYHQRWEEIADLVIRFKTMTFNPNIIREHAERFSKAEFKRKLKQEIDKRMS